MIMVVTRRPPNEGKNPVAATPIPKIRMESADRRCSLMSMMANTASKAKKPGISLTD